MKFGTESNLSSGADVDCASAEVESRPNRTVNQGFMMDLPLRGGFDATNVRLTAVYKRKGLRHNRPAVEAVRNSPVLRLNVTASLVGPQSLLAGLMRDSLWWWRDLIGTAVVEAPRLVFLSRTRF
jgi:hypothetical protein